MFQSDFQKLLWHLTLLAKTCRAVLLKVWFHSCPGIIRFSIFSRLLLTMERPVRNKELLFLFYFCYFSILICIIKICTLLLCNLKLMEFLFFFFFSNNLSVVWDLKRQKPVIRQVNLVLL